jgi:hypothetical protein
LERAIVLPLCHSTKSLRRKKHLFLRDALVNEQNPSKRKAGPYIQTGFPGWMNSPAPAGHSKLSLLAFARGGLGAALLVAACAECKGSHREGDDRCDLGDGHDIVRLLSQLVALMEKITPDSVGTNAKDLTKTLMLVREGKVKRE